MTGYNNYFYGNEISDYGKKNGFVDYATLAKAFDAVLNNDIMEKTYDIGYWEQVSGIVDNTEEIDEKQERIDDIDTEIENLEEAIENNNCDIDSLEEEQKEDSYIDNKEAIEEYKKANKELKEKIEKLEDEKKTLEEKIEQLEEEQEPEEVFQWYIVSDEGANLLQNVNEIVYYNEELDMYLWGVTHYGTSWNYVLTNIPIEYSEDFNK